jgi:enoyl-CoA hydratase/carnithine racemase
MTSTRKTNEERSGLLLEQVGRVSVLTLAKPSRRNAFDANLFAEFLNAIDQADGDPSVGAILVQGTGPSFSAGHDRNAFADLWPQSPSGVIYALFARLPTLKTPMIAAVNGPSVGFGATFQLHCDIVLASPAATLSYPFLELGIVPEAASSVLLEAFVGRRAVFELILTGRTLDAQESLSKGLFSHIVDSADLSTSALALATTIADRPRNVTREAVALLKHARRGEILDAIGREMEALNRYIPSLVKKLNASKKQ